MNVLLEKSLINCHAKGLDSLVLKDGPGMVRLFVARWEHELWRNEVGPAQHLPRTFSVGLHRHHCDVTLQPIVGNVWNVGLDKKNPACLVYVQTYEYVSELLNKGRGGFQPMDEHGIWIPLSMELQRTPRYLRSSELHTIYVPQQEVAAWYVWEGEEGDPHKSLVYTNDSDAENADFSELYQPMTEARLLDDLAIIGVVRPALDIAVSA